MYVHVCVVKEEGMSNKSLFASKKTSKLKVPVADTKNAAGGRAYSLSKRATLAQIACTNCFGGTFYSSAEDSLSLAKQAAMDLINDPEFIAKVAIYSRSKGYMKDMPAFLLAVLGEVDKDLFKKVFPKVIDNGKMLRNVIQIARSGAVTGHHCNMTSNMWRKAIQRWFNERSPASIFKASIGNDPSMRDILRMTRVKPNSAEKAALYGYLVGKDVPFENLPQIVQEYENFKRTKKGNVPDVDFRMLDSLGIGTKEWTEIARRAGWMMTRMNLNTFARHGVFKDKEVTSLVANRLRSREEIEKARAFPYQLYAAWRETESNDGVPHVVKDALQDAMEIAIDNVPTLPGEGFVCMDMSGSMSSPVTGSHGGRKATSVQCVEVAGLIASAVVRKNRSATIYTFNHGATKVSLNPRDTVITNTQKLAKAGGGTDIATPLRELNAKKATGDWIFYVSDMESWIDNRNGWGYYGTGLAEEWATFKKRNPKARLICLDLQAKSNGQINSRPDVLQVGGFSDQVFEVVSSFIEHGLETEHWVKLIDQISLD